MHINQKGSLPLILVFVILVALLGGSLVYNFQLKQENTRLTEMLAASETNIPSNPPNMIDLSNPATSTQNDWKTYESPSGFTIQYPSDQLPMVSESILPITKLYPKPASNTNIQGINMIVDIAVATAPASLSIKNALGEGPKNTYEYSMLTNENENFELFKIDNVDAIRADGVSAGGQSPLTDVIFFKDNNIYEISYYPVNEGNKEIFDKMLDTFKFVD